MKKCFVNRFIFLFFLSVFSNCVFTQSSWTLQTATLGTLYSVAYGNNTFVAVSAAYGTNKVMTSPDGITWTTRSFPEGEYYEVAFGNGIFVITSYGTNKIMYSSNGINWSAASTPAGWNGAFLVTFGNGLFVAWEYGSNNATKTITSPDGINWTLRSAPQGYWWDMTYGNGKFVAISYGRSMTSPDAINWTIATTQDSSYLNVAYGNGIFVTLGSKTDGYPTRNGVVATSTDGLNWTPRNYPGARKHWDDIVYANGYFVAVGRSGALMYSTDGINWTIGTAAAIKDWLAVSYGNNTFVGVSIDVNLQSVMTSALIEPVFTWTGAGGNDLWNNAGNWSGGVVPTTASNIVVSSGTPRLNVDFTFTGSLTLSGSATLTVDAGKTLSIGSGGVVDFGGKEVVFKSDATGTAQLGVVTGTLTGATNVVVERHVPSGKRAFRFFGSPVTTTGNIRDNWMEGATPGMVSGYPYTTTSAYNPNSGYGTHITGSGGTTNGFDESGTNNPSLFTFNNSTGAWAEVTSTASTIGLGNAYRLLIRGNRAYNINGSPTQTATATILRTRGTLSTGTLTSGVQLPALSQVINGWSLVGNPYQSVVDMAGSDVVKTNLTDYYYTWDPRMGTQGAYVAYNYVMNTSANVSSAVNRYVQPGQAFFVQASAAGSAIQFREAGKGAASNQTATFGKNDGKDGYKIEVTQQRNEVTQTGGYASLSMLLYDTDSLARGGTPLDAARVLLGSEYSNNVDVKDGRKFTNLDETMSVKQSNTLLSMELRSLPDTGTLLPLNIAQYRGTKYTLRVFWDRMLTDSTKRAYLRDKFTGKELAIDRNGAYMDHGYTITSDAKSSAADRFEVVFRTASNVVTAVTNWSNGDYVKLYPNPVINLLQVEYRVGIQRELTLKVYDMSGREVMERRQLKSGDQVNMRGLLRGVYQYQLLDKVGKLITSGKIMIS